MKGQGLPQRFDRLQHGLWVGQCPWLVGLAEADDAFFVNNNHRANRGPAVLIPQVVSLRDLTLGMPIRELGIGNAAQR